MLTRALLLAPLLLVTGAATAEDTDRWAPQSLSCAGIAKQSGLIRCSGPADTAIEIRSEEGGVLRTVRTSDTGKVLVGLKQNESASISLAPVGSPIRPIDMAIAPRNDDFRLIRGFNCDKVDARTEAQKQHAADSWVKKQDAFARFNPGPGVRDGFIRPVDGPASSPYGPTRKYVGTGANGEPCEKVSVHEGYDFAVPTGTPVQAPAGGTVILADPDLYYEGGTVFLDHGDGLVSVFLHLSEVSVEQGHVIGQGETIGKTGNTGRTTGPHLHWAVKWRNTATEARDGDFYIDPALLLDLEPR